MANLVASFGIRQAYFQRMIRGYTREHAWMALSVEEQPTIFIEQNVGVRRPSQPQIHVTVVQKKIVRARTRDFVVG